jgi:hypothetical protein
MNCKLQNSAADSDPGYEVRWSFTLWIQDRDEFFPDPGSRIRDELSF